MKPSRMHNVVAGFASMTIKSGRKKKTRTPGELVSFLKKNQPERIQMGMEMIRKQKTLT
jgi:hypothetical protein